MKKLLLPSLVLLTLAVAGLCQDVKPEPSASPAQGRGDLLKQLGLSSEQMAQIRQLNQQRKPAMEEAQLRVREANKALDAAIYADTVDEALVAARLEDLQKAQGEVSRIRFNNELSIRRILTAEQLGRFREMRRQVAGTMEERRQQRMQNPGANPNRGLRRQNMQTGKPPAAPVTQPVHPKP